MTANIHRPARPFRALALTLRFAGSDFSPQRPRTLRSSMQSSPSTKSLPIQFSISCRPDRVSSPTQGGCDHFDSGSTGGASEPLGGNQTPLRHPPFTAERSTDRRGHGKTRHREGLRRSRSPRCGSPGELCRRLIVLRQHHLELLFDAEGIGGGARPEPPTAHADFARAR